MNLILLQEDDFQDQPRSNNDPAKVILLGQRAQHIQQVLKAEVGQQLKVGLLGGQHGMGTVRSIEPMQCELDVSLNSPPPAKLPLTLLLALPRPKVARRIIHAATELGVSEIILLNSYRVEKSYWQSPLVDDAHLHNAMLEGLSQSGDTMLPTLQRQRLFKPFVEDQLPELLQQRRGLVAHPYASPLVASTPLTTPTLLAIGPEGGFIPYEFEKLLEAGLQGFSLGERILKVETALPTLIAKLFY